MLSSPFSSTTDRIPCQYESTQMCLPCVKESTYCTEAPKVISRREMIRKVIELIQLRIPSARRRSLRPKILTVAKEVEANLFQLAPSMEAYSDLTSLPLRVRSLAQLKKQHQNKMRQNSWVSDEHVSIHTDHRCQKKQSLSVTPNIFWTVLARHTQIIPHISLKKHAKPQVTCWSRNELRKPYNKYTCLYLHYTNESHPETCPQCLRVNWPRQ